MPESNPPVGRMHASEIMILLFQRFCWLDEGLQQHFHDHGWPDVSRSQSMIMINIVSGIRRPSDIARRIGISRQAIHTTIQQMIDSGIVTLESDPLDGRTKLLALTEFGQRMRNDAHAGLTSLAERVAGQIGEAKWEALYDALAPDWGNATQ